MKIVIKKMRGLKVGSRGELIDIIDQLGRRLIVGQRVYLGTLPDTHPLRNYEDVSCTIVELDQRTDGFYAYIQVDGNPRIIGFEDGVNGINRERGPYLNVTLLRT